MSIMASQTLPLRACIWSALAISALAPVNLAAQSPERQSLALDVRVVRDVTYRNLEPGEDPKKGKTKLDLFLPADRKEFPVVVFVHGGAWVHGDKERSLYRSLALNWARKGIGTVLINYRLSPGVKHPEHVKDVAKAVSWTFQHISEYGGRRDQLFISGHSAGGHLVSLLATDDSYLRAEGVNPNVIRGVISICGVYRVHDLAAHAAMALQAGEKKEGSALEARLAPITAIFGSDLKVRKQASPISHVHPGIPPFLVLYAEHDLPRLADMAREFDSLLQQQKCDACMREIKGRNHVSIVWRIPRDGDPAGIAIADFIAKHTSTK
jgi:acetyl esterase/lipase